MIAKADTLLPNLPGVTIWIEPPTPRHPLVGITHALALAGRRPIVVCAGDLPFVTPELIDRLAHADPAGAPAVIASREGETQPLLGCYQQAASKLLAPAAAADAPLREAVAAIGPRLFEIEDVEELFNVNAPDDLLMASAMLYRRRRVSQS